MHISLLVRAHWEKKVIQFCPSFFSALRERTFLSPLSTVRAYKYIHNLYSLLEKIRYLKITEYIDIR